MFNYSLSSRRLFANHNTGVSSTRPMTITYPPTCLQHSNRQSFETALLLVPVTPKLNTYRPVPVSFLLIFQHNQR